MVPDEMGTGPSMVQSLGASCEADGPSRIVIESGCEWDL